MSIIGSTVQSTDHLRQLVSIYSTSVIPLIEQALRATPGFPTPHWAEEFVTPVLDTSFEGPKGRAAGLFKARLSFKNTTKEGEARPDEPVDTRFTPVISYSEDFIVAIRKIGVNESDTIHIENRRFESHRRQLEQAGEGLGHVGLVYFVANRDAGGVDIIVLPDLAIRSALSDSTSGITRGSSLTISRTEGWQSRIASHGGAVAHLDLHRVAGQVE